MSERPSSPSEAPGIEAGTRLGERPLTLAANTVLLTLSRAARSFNVYSPENETVRRLISAYQEASREALGLFGALTYNVHPFEMELEGEIVYREQDRDRSLAFRLYRDGVRKVVIREDAPWEELLKLLEVFSIRYSGIRQPEDDMVTLLRKAEFKGIDIYAVEGFLPDEEDPETDVAIEQHRRITRALPPDDWDRPLPELSGEEGELRYRPIPDRYLERLREEEAPEMLSDAAVLAVREMLFLAAMPGDAVTSKDVLPFVTEVSEFLLVEGYADKLLTLMSDIETALPLDDSAARVLERLTSYKIIRRYARAPTHNEDALMELLEHVEGDHVISVLDLLVEEREPEHHARLDALLARMIRENPEDAAKHVAEAPIEVAAQLFDGVRSIAPDAASEVAFSLTDHPALELQMSALRSLAKAPNSGHLGTALRELRHSQHEQVRNGAVQLYAKRRGKHGLQALAEHAEDRAENGVGRDEAIVIGKSLAFADPRGALALAVRWTHPKGLGRLLGGIGRLPDGPRMLQFIGAAALGYMGGAVARRHLAELAHKGADQELAMYCAELVNTLDREGRGG